MSSWARIAASIGLAAALLVPPGAHGTVTIGSNLGSAPSFGTNCLGATCTIVQNDLPAAQQATGGVKSPVSGSVVLWRVRTAAGVQQPIAFRVVRQITTGSLYTGVTTSATVTPPANSTTAYNVQLPITMGDLIGINCCQVNSTYFRSAGPAAGFYWNPALADGDPGRAPTGSVSSEITINADIEPTSAFAVNGVKLGKGGKVTPTVTLPNPGTLVGGDARDASLAGAAGGKKKATYLKRSSLPVGVAGQTIRLQVLPTKRARALLTEKGRLKAKLKLVFTPTGGTASTQSLKVKLKK